jgi:hypothetical protein
MPWIKCKVCGKDKYHLPCNIAKGYGKYCSLKCHREIRDYRNVPKGEQSKCWKGSNIGYGGVHVRLRKMRGKAKLCEICGDTYQPEGKRRFEWAQRKDTKGNNIMDFFRACCSCHRKYDMTEEKRKNLSKAHKGQVAWNKGINPPIKYQCPVCGKDVFRKEYEKSQAHYCSRKCKGMGYKLGFTIVASGENRKNKKTATVAQEEFNRTN